MGTAVVTTRIAARAEDVFSVLVKINRYPRWDAFANEIVSASNARLKAGVTYTVRSGMEQTSWRVTFAEPPWRMIHVGRVGFMGEVTREFRLEPFGDECELVQTVTFALMPGFARPLGWLAEKLFVERMLKQRLRQSGEGAKAMVGSEA